MIKKEGKIIPSESLLSFTNPTHWDGSSFLLLQTGFGSRGKEPSFGIPSLQALETPCESQMLLFGDSVGLPGGAKSRQLLRPRLYSRASALPVRWPTQRGTHDFLVSKVQGSL